MSLRQYVTPTADGRDGIASAINQSTGTTDGSKILCTNAQGVIDPSFLPPGVEIAVESIVCSEAVASGNFVNIWNDAGVRKIRKADAALGRPAHGYVLSGYDVDAVATVYLNNGTNNQLSSLNVGSSYFLSDTTAGTATETPPASTPGTLLQLLGYASSSNNLEFTFSKPKVYL